MNLVRIVFNNFTVHTNPDKFEDETLPRLKMNGRACACVHTTPPSRRFQMSPLWRPFSKSSVFVTENTVLVWTGRPSRISVEGPA